MLNAVILFGEDISWMGLARVLGVKMAQALVVLATSSALGPSFTPFRFCTGGFPCFCTRRVSLALVSFDQAVHFFLLFCHSNSIL